MVLKEKLYLFSEETSTTQQILVEQNMWLLAELENQNKELEKEHRWADEMEKALKSVPGSSIAAAEHVAQVKLYILNGIIMCVIASFVAQNV